jgi:hypothetical protein
MDLNSIKPKESNFYLRITNKTYTMRPITMADEQWLERTYGQKQMQDIFEKLNLIEIARIVYRLLVNEDKESFKKQTVRFVNEDGDEETEELGGYKLLISLVSGWEEKIALTNALLENMGFSRPLDPKDKPEEEEGEEKKSQ